MGYFKKGIWIDHDPVSEHWINEWKNEIPYLEELLSKLQPNSPRYDMCNERLNLIKHRLESLKVI